MRRLRVWGFSAALLAALGVATATAAEVGAGDESQPAAARSGWSWDVFGLFGSKDKPAPKPDKSKPKPGEAAAKESAPPRPTAAEVAALRAEHEGDKWARRVAACDRLKEIARATNDPQLERTAQQLDERAWTIYQQRAGAETSASTTRGEAYQDARPSEAGSVHRVEGPASANEAVQDAPAGNEATVHQVPSPSNQGSTLNTGGRGPREE